MPNRQKKPRMPEGPYLVAAFFCEQIIADKADGALNAIRIIDQINIAVAPTPPGAPEFPSDENRLPVAIAGLLSFKTGKSRKKQHTVRVEMESPSGKKNPPFEQTIPFSDVDHGGANLILRNVVRVLKGGLFYFNVYLDGNLVTRMPLLIEIKKLTSEELQALAAPQSGSQLTED
jgi:hypothetical protein